MVGVLMLLGCTNPPDPRNDQQGGAPRPNAVEGTTVIRPGYYASTRLTANAPGTHVALWLRSDSTYILQRALPGSDSVPTGMVGTWSTRGADLILAGQRPEPPMRWHAAGDQLEERRLDGTEYSHGSTTLDKLADDVGDAIPRMRLVGTFIYYADAQSFKPCGSSYTWPCVGGMDLGEVDGEPLAPFSNIDLQQAYAKAVAKGGDPWLVEVVCTMGMGPAMEGDGADEYIYVEAVLGTVEGKCP